MKRYILFTLAICLVLSGCTSGAIESTSEIEEVTTTTDATVPVPDDTSETKPSESTTAPTQKFPPTTAPAQTEPPATEPPHSHSYSATGTTAPTCESQGYTTYKCACGSSYKDNYTAALGHSYSSTVVEPTKESQGYTQYTCGRCGSSYRDNYTDKLPQYTAAEYESLVVQYVLQYLNEHRAAVGSPVLTSLPGMSQVADYRADQLTNNFEHDTADEREALAHFQYGRYVDATQYGSDASNSYYTADASETICSVWDYGDPQRLAKEIADGFRASSGHWRSLGKATNIYAGIGVAFHNNYCYGCIWVGPVNYG